MLIKIWTMVVVTIVSLGIGGWPWISSPAQAEGCLDGDIIDASSAQSAKKKMEAAGFLDISGLKKSCDNFWHATAVRNGVAVNIVLTPQGQVIIEGN
ncbi:PepSY domain-containing protein [Magnetospirillum moscoviense]|uniref:Uncharacterized protein n=1 Tax=Magnetospirillum moscoviense TaxID=1437059 RepID=A0A178MT75_9PROT|nr:PepSY domain-containing protein [Magnetospirillum moscoviense]MBF0324510.1 PepSY domain-containing protein [Alphaproteobacteria bacterium]OAN51535.1 hypothetical protein A6A05_01345 [Magnetospirillum moscoviense]